MGCLGHPAGWDSRVATVFCSFGVATVPSLAASHQWLPGGGAQPCGPCVCRPHTSALDGDGLWKRAFEEGFKDAEMRTLWIIPKDTLMSFLIRDGGDRGGGVVTA